MDQVGKVSWKRFEKYLLSFGCEFKGQKGTSHRKYKKAGLLRPVIVPHENDLPTLVIMSNLRTLGVSKEDFIEAMKKIK